MDVKHFTAILSFSEYIYFKGQNIFNAWNEVFYVSHCTW